MADDPGTTAGRRRGRRRSWLALAVLVGAVGLGLAPGLVERAANRVVAAPGVRVSEQARALHRRLLVADLHADSLLWSRNLVGRSSRGHVDLPRLAEGGVALQVFTVVTKAPRGLNIERNDDTSDNITLLALLQRWPLSTWSSLRARALYQAERLDHFAEASGGRLLPVRTAAELRRFRETRVAGDARVAALLGLEGAHALEADPANVDVLFQAGFRMLAPVHFFDNALGGSAHGIAKGGLTPLGARVVRRMEQLGMVVDLAHASPALFDEVLGVATRPVVVSHTGVRGTCDNRRNLSDAQLRAVAAAGGLVGIGFWDTAVCGSDVRAIARAVGHALAVAGVNHVALGSDFDGAVTTPFDASQLPQLTQALLDEGLSEQQLAAVMGGNTLRFFEASLPGGDP